LGEKDMGLIQKLGYVPKKGCEEKKYNVRKKMGFERK